MNPFEENNEGVEMFEVCSEKPPLQPTSLTVDTIADYLLKKQYILTALELHTEILETGKELPRLKNYFSNPGNFEQYTSFRDSSNTGSLYRTSSCSTFDSLDLTRFSDDEHQQVDDRLAVLEFELRKAKDTIKSLRSNLTDAVEQDSFLKSSTMATDAKDEGGEQDIDSAKRNLEEKVRNEELMPLEKRAVNYLINEYLLQNEYKLTSITLADENDDQDFEDWDDVGLNMPKPPNLLILFREFASHEKVNFQNDEVQDNHISNEQKELIESLQNECLKLQQENAELSSMMMKLQEQTSSNHCGYDTSTPSKLNGACSENGLKILESSQCDGKVQTPENGNLQSVVQEKPDGEKQVVKSDALNFDEKSEKAEANSNNNHLPSASRMSVEFWTALSTFAQVTLEDDWLLTKVNDIASTCENLVMVLSDCLPKIVPSVLLQKRDQLIPILLSTAAMHPDENCRNLILHDLFNLFKKPDEKQRQMILFGCVAYAKHVGTIQTEEDLLPQCWEQIGHKYSERRHLVAEACGALAPYVRAEIRSSLLLSILQQMQQDEKTQEVRQAVVRSLAVVFALLHDDDKYRHSFEILCSFLRDPSLPVRETTRSSLLPSFASWSRQRGKLHSHLLEFVLDSIESIAGISKHENNSDFNSTSFLDHMEMLHILLPHFFIHLLESMPPQLKCRNEEPREVSRTKVECNALWDPVVIIGNVKEYNSLLAAFDASIGESNFDDWEILNWCLDHFLPRLQHIVRSVSPEYEKCVSSLSKLFQCICLYFGRPFVDSKLKEQFQTLFFMTGKDINHQISSGRTSLTSAAVAVYASGVLATFNDKPYQELSTFLKEMIVNLSACYASLDSVKSAFLEIRKKYVALHELLVEVLWTCVTNASANIRANAAFIFTVMVSADVESRILTNRILPALITLSTDINSSVRTASIPALGTVVECPNVSREIVDQIITHMTTFMLHNRSDDESGGPMDHNMNLQLVRTMAQVGPKAHPKFRDEFVLPHLAALAAGNNQATNRTKQSDIALELLNAYSNISCCFISDSLLQGAFLPGIKCLLRDIELLHPEHTASVKKLIKEKEAKLDRGSITSSGSFDNSTASVEKNSKNESKIKFNIKLF